VIASRAISLIASDYYHYLPCCLCLIAADLNVRMEGSEEDSLDGLSGMSGGNGSNGGGTAGIGGGVAVSGGTEYVFDTYNDQRLMQYVDGLLKTSTC